MMTDSQIWIAFARMAGMLLIVLAVIIFGFYLIKRFATARSLKGSRNLIHVLAMHHLSPKEKIVLLDVMDEIILIGVTPHNISKISHFPAGRPIEKSESKKPLFSEFLTGKLKQAFPMRAADGQEESMKEPVEETAR